MRIKQSLRKFSLILFLLSIPSLLATGLTDTGKFTVSVSYFGEMIAHPGIKVGLGYSLYSNDWYELNISTNLGFYLHRNNYRGLLLSLETGNRFTSNFGLFGDFDLGIGYLHTWTDGRTYNRSKDGEIKELRNPGYPHFLLIGSLGPGWNFSKKTALPIQAHFYLSIFGEYPFNGYMLPHAAIQLGLTYKF